MRQTKFGSGGGYPRVTPIGPGMRILFAILGVAAIVPVVLIAMNELHAMSDGSRAGPVIMLAFCAVVLIGALSLLLASVRGTAVVRKPRR